jgi:hypothetical protein
MSNFNYRIDNDDIGSTRKYLYAYLAQFEYINENIQICNVKIELPRIQSENLYRNPNTIYCLISAVLEKSKNTIIIRNIQGINVTDGSDFIPLEFEEFFKNCIVADRFDNYNYKIIYEDDDEYIIHKMMNKIIFKIINKKYLDVLDLHIDIHEKIMNCLYENTITKCDFVKKDINYFLNIINNIDITKLWFDEDKDNRYF